MSKFRPGRRKPCADPHADDLSRMMHAEMVALSDRLAPFVDRSVNARAMAWAVSGDTGPASLAIWARMLDLDGVYPHRTAAPIEVGELGRCVRLLAFIPEWRPKLARMADVGGEWAAFAEHWDELETKYTDECGLFAEMDIGTVGVSSLILEVRTSNATRTDGVAANIR